jgi:hypothetical protein
VRRPLQQALQAEVIDFLRRVVPSPRRPHKSGLGRSVHVRGLGDAVAMLTAGMRISEDNTGGLSSATWSIEPTRRDNPAPS